ncbi:MAG: hypothetical protein ACLTAM_01655, partial [Collinsella sp.]
MDSRETKRTVPVPSVGADGEQPISQTPTASITEETTENNPPEKNYAELLRKMQRLDCHFHCNSLRTQRNAL